MTEGGARIGRIKGILAREVKAGVTPMDLENLATKLILEGGDKPSFKMVPGYFHTLCVNVNEGLVHGIPNDTPFKPGDVVKVDMGLFHEGFHLDTAITVAIEPVSEATKRFLEAGKEAQAAAIAKAVPGNSIYDISEAMEEVLLKHGYSAIRDLTGHGVGRELHMEPYIPCYTDRHSKKDLIGENQTLAIEVMYAMGDYHLVEDSDGWTISTQDKSLTGMWEESVYVAAEGPIILTGLK